MATVYVNNPKTETGVLRFENLVIRIKCEKGKYVACIMHKKKFMTRDVWNSVRDVPASFRIIGEFRENCVDCEIDKTLLDKSFVLEKKKKKSGGKRKVRGSWDSKFVLTDRKAQNMAKKQKIVIPKLPETIPLKDCDLHKILVDCGLDLYKTLEKLEKLNFSYVKN